MKHDFLFAVNFVSLWRYKALSIPAHGLWNITSYEPLYPRLPKLTFAENRVDVLNIKSAVSFFVVPINFALTVVAIIYIHCDEKCCYVFVTFLRQVQQKTDQVKNLGAE